MVHTWAMPGKVHTGLILGLEVWYIWASLIHLGINEASEDTCILTAYIQAKAACEVCMNKHSSDEQNSDSDASDEDSNKSCTSYSSEGNNES
jgi:hypothetical protein